MEEMMKALKRKSQIVYDMNCIEKYIKVGEFDESLSKTWNTYKKALEEVETELKLLSNPNTKALEERKLNLRHKIEEHKGEITKLEHQIEELNKRMMSMSL